MIRNNTLSKVKRTLDSHKRFNSSDFTIKVSKEDTLSIRYDYDEQFYIEFYLPSETTKVNKETKETRLTRTYVTEKIVEEYQFTGRRCPGKITLVESLDFYGETNFYDSINSWLNSLWEELMSIPTQRQFEEQEKIINELKEKIKDIPDSYFEYEEAENLKSKLDELEKKLDARLEKEISDKNELKKKLEELHLEFENLKQTIHSVKKSGWYKSFIVKTFTWFTKEENRKFLKETKDFIEPFLPDNIKNLLPPK